MNTQAHAELLKALYAATGGHASQDRAARDWLGAPCHDAREPKQLTDTPESYNDFLVRRGFV